jgi:hypothetical protein
VFQLKLPTNSFFDILLFSSPWVTAVMVRAPVADMMRATCPQMRWPALAAGQKVVIITQISENTLLFFSRRWQVVSAVAARYAFCRRQRAADGHEPGC